MFPVTEYFVSINGEGMYAGELAVFVRFRGCNLNCSYCDTGWSCSANAPARLMSVEEITSMVTTAGISNVTLTGGEPLCQKNISALTDSLISDGRRVEIETNGSVFIGDLAKRILRPIFTMDYKLPSSGMEEKMCLDNFSYLNNMDTVKFVVGDADDLKRTSQIIDRFSLINKCNVLLSPVFGRIDPEAIVDYMKQKKMNGVRLQLQIHKYIWDPMKRGV